MEYKIKLSNKLLIIGFLVPILSFIIIVSILSGNETNEEMYKFKNAHQYILLRSGELIKSSDDDFTMENSVTRNFSFTGYSILKFEGGWDINVKESTEGIRLAGTEELMNKVSVEQDGETLTFKINKINQAVMAKADISLIKLRGIVTKGPANIYFSDIDEDGEVLIKCEGVANIVSDNASFKSLILKSQGALNADFLNGYINSLELDYQAVGSIDAYFKEGVLSGSMVGSGSLNAFGEVLSNKIELKSENVKVVIK